MRGPEWIGESTQGEPLNSCFMEYFDCRLRVRYAETDQMGMAHHSAHLVWFEVARSEFCRSRGFSYERMERESGTFMPVAEIYCRYRRPLRYDREFVVRIRIRELRKRTITFSYQLLGPDDEVVHALGYSKHVVADREGRPKTLPEEYLALLSGAQE